MAEPGHPSGVELTPVWGGGNGQGVRAGPRGTHRYDLRRTAGALRDQGIKWADRCLSPGSGAHRAQGSTLRLWEKKGLSGTWTCTTFQGSYQAAAGSNIQVPSQLFRVSARKCLEAMPRSLADSMEGTAELSRAEACGISGRRVTPRVSPSWPAVQSRTSGRGGGCGHERGFA